jgi:hypothetical protein
VQLDGRQDTISTRTHCSPCTHTSSCHFAQACSWQETWVRSLHGRAQSPSVKPVCRTLYPLVPSGLKANVSALANTCCREAKDCSGQTTPSWPYACCIHNPNHCQDGSPFSQTGECVITNQASGCGYGKVVVIGGI